MAQSEIGCLFDEQKIKNEELIVACRNSDFAKVKALVDSGADVYFGDEKGVTPLLIVSQIGHLGLVQYLLSKGADLNEVTKDGTSPLLLASNYGHLNVVRCLVEDNADVNILNNQRVSPLHIASQNGHLDLLQYLVEHNADVNLQTDEGVSALHTGCHFRHLDVVRYLVEVAKANVNLQNNIGATPLFFASQNGDLDIVKYLVEQGEADINLQTNQQRTSLLIAAQRGHLDVVRFLVENGADISSSVEFAASQNSNELMSALLQVETDEIDLLITQSGQTLQELLQGYKNFIKGDKAADEVKVFAQYKLQADIYKLSVNWVNYILESEYKEEISGNLWELQRVIKRLDIKCNNAELLNKMSEVALGNDYEVKLENKIDLPFKEINFVPSLKSLISHQILLNLEYYKEQDPIYKAASAAAMSSLKKFIEPCLHTARGAKLFSSLQLEDKDTEVQAENDPIKPIGLDSAHSIEAN